MKFLPGIVLLAFTAYLLIGAAVPYYKAPEVSEAYKGQFRVEDFYGEGIFCDRAAIVEENVDALEWRIRMIEQAEERIVMSTFNIKADHSGRQVLGSLQAAAERGVRIQILADGFNSWLDMEGNPYFYALSSMDNVEIKLYNRVDPFVPWKGMSRMHDKYLVVDEDVYLLGGRNTFDFFLGDAGYKNYDREVLVYNTGGTESSLYQVLDYFEAIWKSDCCKLWRNSARLAKLPSVRSAAQELKEIYGRTEEEHPDWMRKTDYEKETVPVSKITLLSNPTGLYNKEPWVFYGLCELMGNARESVKIHTPYILCDDMMYEAFQNLCKRGIPVTMMTNSARNNGNSFGAVDYVLHKERVLDTGLEILEYDGGISYHGKSLVIDDDIAIVGSFNMDMKSAYQDTELMLVVNSRELNRQLKDNMSVYERDARPAAADEEEITALFDKEEPFSKRILRFLIMKLDPYLRFLM